MSKITSDDPRPARGRQRQAELGAEMKSAVAINSRVMLRGLNRPVSQSEIFLAEAISALFLRASRLRDGGRDDSEILLQAAKLQQGSVFACLNPSGVPLAPEWPAAVQSPPIAPDA
jgi:hypothetical protein